MVTWATHNNFQVISNTTSKYLPTVKLIQMNTFIGSPMLSLPKPNPSQSFLYKMITCLTRPAMTFFVPQITKPV